LEIGSTLPKENILKHWQGGYEHPHGAGRSLEAHLVGSAKIVIGKNRDEEDALDAQILGQSVIRLGRMMHLFRILVAQYRLKFEVMEIFRRLVLYSSGPNTN